MWRTPASLAARVKATRFLHAKRKKHVMKEDIQASTPLIYGSSGSRAPTSANRGKPTAELVDSMRE
jgi:hypothetical protein